MKPTVVCGAHPGPPEGFGRCGAPVASADAHEHVVRVRPDRELLPGSCSTEAHESGRVKSRRVHAGHLEQHPQMPLEQSSPS